MKEGKASYSAEFIAAFRGIESQLPASQRVCYDPFAIVFTSPVFRTIGKSHLLIKAVYWYLVVRRGFFGSLGQAVVRTKFIDDYLKKCIDGNIEQLVILGAGLDSRAYRFDGLKGKTKVFEVDHPTTQKRKMERVEKVLGSLPGHVMYVPVDFNREDLGKRLLESGYNPDSKTLFIWEGVTYYLTPESVDQTLAFVVENSGPGSSIIFDYILPSVVDGTCNLDGARLVADYQRNIGEPLVFGIDDTTIEEWLSARGFFEVNNVTGKDLERSYFRAVGRDTRTYHWFIYAHAKVKPRQQ
jgi:methyltransferase (TIGR00027 family)